MSEISFDDFSGKVADLLQIEKKTLLLCELSDISEYDSMAKINISLLIEEIFGFQIEYEHLDSASKIEDLFDICLRERS